MFAFALWDRSSQTLFAARDRFGKKPFYYTLQNGVFAFASELTALRQLPFLRFETTLATLARFVAYEYVPTPETIYKNVFKLRPGHSLLFRDGAVTEAPYWDMADGRAAGAAAEPAVGDKGHGLAQAHVSIL